MAAHFAVTPSSWKARRAATLTLTVHATTERGSPMAGAKVVYTVTVEGLGPIVSPELTTDGTGTAIWRVTVSGGSAGIGAATALVTSSAGDQVSATVKLTTT
jgi:hypothetical protein